MNSPESKPQGSEQPEAEIITCGHCGHVGPARHGCECPGCGSYIGITNEVIPNPSADEEVETPRTDALEAQGIPIWDGKPNYPFALDVWRKHSQALERELTQLRQQHNAEREEARAWRNGAEEELIKAGKNIGELCQTIEQLRASLADSKHALDTIAAIVSPATEFKDGSDYIRAVEQYAADTLITESELATAQKTIESLNQLHEISELFMHCRICGEEVGQDDSGYWYHIHRAGGPQRHDHEPEPRPSREWLEKEADQTSSLRSQLQTAMEERDNLKTQLTVAQAEIKRQKELLTFPGIYER